MKVEFRLSVLSKRESLLGIQIEQHNGINYDEGDFYNEREIEVNIGLIFFIVGLCFIQRGERINEDEHLRGMRKMMDEIIKEDEINSLNK